MDHNQSLFVLLVGIDEYASANVPDLGGCVNDVAAMAQLLRDKFKAPPENIKILTNDQATHQNIKDAFRSQLIDRAQAWLEAGRPEPAPAFLFHYSGHGSQAPDPTGAEPDGLDETIVPHDSRLGDVYDIKDWELGQLIAELTHPFVDEEEDAYWGNVTIILDCCHSGSGTRLVSRNILPTRRCQPDLRPQLTQRPIAGTRGATASGWSMAGAWRKKDERYVLLAGCRDREEANEHVVREGDGRRQHGALTYFLIQELAQMNPDRPLTYFELHQRVSHQVNSRYKHQMPQCEGDRNREVFGGLRPARDPFLTVVDKSEGLIWVNGGIAHGLTDGSQLKVYPENIRTLDEAGLPLATLEVKSVGAVRTGCRVIEGEPNIPINAKAVVYLLDPVGLKRQVSLDMAGDVEVEQAIRTRLAEADLKEYIEIIEGEGGADYRLVKMGNQLQIQDGTGVLLVAPFGLTDLHELGRDLAHLVRYQNALNLSNRAGDSALAGKVSLEIKKLVFDPDTQAPLAEAFPRTLGGELILQTNDRFVIQVTNQAPVPLYFTILEFGFAWDINQLYPQIEGANEPLAPNQTYFLGLSADPEEQYDFSGLDPDIAEIQEVVKVIATKEDTNFEILTQGELKMPHTQRRSLASSPLEQLLDLAMTMDEGVRGAIRKRKPSVKDAWTTTQVSLTVIQPPASEGATHSLSGDRATALPGYDLHLEPPPGFRGGVRILTERQSVRALGDDPADLKPPPGLAGFGHLFQPLPVQSTRAAAPGGAVIEIEADDEARNQITAETPLKMYLPPEMVDQAAPVVALAFDGNFYYPVGRPGESRTINIEWLPDATPAQDIPLRGRRNIGRTVKLYLYKTLNWDEPSLGLHQARFVEATALPQDQVQATELTYQVSGGEVRYRDLKSDEIKAGQRIALMVHGFTSETRWMVFGLAHDLAREKVTYDRILTFDYETFNTPVSDNGLTLARALQKAGFGPDDGVHLDVYAHSMGTQVVRSMVEQHGGEAFVDRCFLAGPPNQGTRLADAKKLIPWLGTLLLNQFAPTPPTLIAGWALKKITDAAVGAEDLRPNSDFLKGLNSIDQEAKVPYYILAGSNNLSEAEAGIWKRFSQRMSKGTDIALDTIFGDQHDLVINVKSMITVRDGYYPEALLHTRIVPCNHFAYFSHPEAWQQILALAQSIERIKKLWKPPQISKLWTNKLKRCTGPANTGRLCL